MLPRVRTQALLRGATIACEAATKRGHLQWQAAGARVNRRPSACRTIWRTPAASSTSISKPSMTARRVARFRGAHRYHYPRRAAPRRRDRRHPLEYRGWDCPGADPAGVGTPTQARAGRGSACTAVGCGLSGANRGLKGEARRIRFTYPRRRRSLATSGLPNRGLRGWKIAGRRPSGPRVPQPPAKPGKQSRKPDHSIA